MHELLLVPAGENGKLHKVYDPGKCVVVKTHSQISQVISEIFIHTCVSMCVRESVIKICMCTQIERTESEKSSGHSAELWVK